MIRRESREGKEFIDNPQCYKKKVSHRRLFGSSFGRKADIRSPKEEKDYSSTKETIERKKSPLLKQKRVGSYDSGYPEDEKRKVLRKTKQFTSQPGRKTGHKRSHLLCRKCNKGAVGFFLKSGSSTINTDESSDNEVFPVKNKEYFSCYDSDIASQNLRERREIRRKRNRHHNQFMATSTSPGRPTSNSPGRPTRGCRRRRIYHAIAMYQATSDDTIDLYEGDEVQVIRKSRGGWWYVRIDDEEGWAPSNFLEPITWYDD